MYTPYPVFVCPLCISIAIIQKLNAALRTVNKFNENVNIALWVCVGD